MSWFKRAVGSTSKAILRWSGAGPMPGYAHLDGATVFPAENAHLLRYPEYFYFHDALVNLWDEVVVEEGAFLGHQVMFLTGRHDRDAEGWDVEAFGSSGPIRVGRRAWIGSRAIVLGGVEIGSGSAIGAGAVVTENVPPHQFWAGNPARFVRRLDGPDRPSEPHAPSRSTGQPST